MAAPASSRSEDLTAKAYHSLRRMIVEGRVHPRQRLSHRALSEAIRRRDAPAARAAMVEHVAWARQEMPERSAAVAESSR